MNKPFFTIKIGPWSDGSHWQAGWDNGRKGSSYYGIGRVGDTRQEAIDRLLEAMIEQGYIKAETLGDKS